MKVPNLLNTVVNQAHWAGEPMYTLIMGLDEGVGFHVLGKLNKFSIFYRPRHGSIARKLQHLAKL